MAKKIYIGDSSDIARKISKAYVGDSNNIARKIIKGYVGDSNNIAREFFRYYTPLNYLESTGTQYIDTGVNGIWTNTLHIITKFALNSKSSIEQCILGDKKSNNNGTTIFFTSTSGNLTTWSGSGTTQVISSSISIGTAYDLDVTFTIPKGRSGTFNGTSFDYTTVSNNVYLNTENFAIFSSKYNSAYEIFNGKIYFLKIIKDNTLVRDFIPVLDQDGTPCLYDKIENKFYYNQGTGTFNYG